MSETAPAQVVVLCGPSGAGKSRLARRLHEHQGWPIVRLDDFYKDGDDPSLPMLEAGLPDWDDPASWDRARALTALAALCRDGQADLPTYDLAASAAIGHKTVRLGDSTVVVAEGIFAGQIIGELAREGLLRDALCICHRRSVTFARRLVRDMREHRKPPAVLWRRGLLLRRRETEFVAAQIAMGARTARPRDAFAALTGGRR